MVWSCGTAHVFGRAFASVRLSILPLPGLAARQHTQLTETVLPQPSPRPCCLARGLGLIFEWLNVACNREGYLSILWYSVYLLGSSHATQVHGAPWRPRWSSVEFHGIARRPWAAMGFHGQFHGKLRSTANSAASSTAAFHGSPGIVVPTRGTAGKCVEYQKNVLHSCTFAFLEQIC